MRSGKIIKRIIQLAPVLMIVLMAVIYFTALKDLTLEQVLNYTPTAPLAAAAVILLMYALKSLSYFFPMLLIAAAAGAVLKPQGYNGVHSLCSGKICRGRSGGQACRKARENKHRP